MKTYNLMMLSDSVMLPTGYANQSRALAKRLAKEPEFEINYIAAQYAGMPLLDSEMANFFGVNPPRDVPRVLENGGRAYGEGITEYWMDKYKSDLLWVLLDSFMVYHLKDVDLKPRKFIMYFPSDGYPLPLGCEHILRKADSAVAMSKFAQAQAIDMGINANYIPHAVDTTNFYPLPQEIKDNLRKRWSQRLRYQLEDKFIVGYVGRNQGRKMLDLLFKAFAKFAATNPNAILMLHSDPWDGAAACNLVELAKRLGISDRVVYTGANIHNGFTERELMEIYNLFDIYASSSSGEGYGICTAESMACGVPPILIDYTTTREIVTDHNAGIAVPVAAFLVGSYNVDRGIIDVDKMGQAMQYLKDNPSEIQRMGKNGRQAVLNEYSWKTVYPTWKNHILEVLEK